MHRLTNKREHLRWRLYPVHFRAIHFHAVRIMNGRDFNGVVTRD